MPRILKSIISFTLLSVLIFLILPSSVLAQTEQPSDVNIYFFWGDGCPHCEEEKLFLKSLVEKYPQVKLNDYEVWYDTTNQDVLRQFADLRGFSPQAVPITIIGDQYWIGFREEFLPEFETAIQNCLDSLCSEDVGAVVFSKPRQEEQLVQKSDHLVNIPLIGLLDLDKQSLVVSTAVIGFIDGFNPCSLWVLSILLALTLHSRSRTKILLVGLTFLIVTTIVYSLFIAGVFTLLSYIGYLKWIQLLVAAIAIIFGVINLKDYFWYKEGISFTISDRHKPKMYKNMRSTVTNPRTILGLISSTSVLAVGISLIEFACTAGFPVIWSNLLVTNNVSTWTFLLLLGLYMLIYLLDELVIFGAAVITMKASKIEEKHGRLLKLISGMIIFVLGLVMVVNPDLMNQISSSLLVFSSAIIAAMIVYFIHQQIFPKFGIYIGTGFDLNKFKKHK